MTEPRLAGWARLVAWAAEARGIVAIAATYVYFLLFAQYGFLGLFSSRLPGASIRPVMAAMGLAGLGASAGAAMLLRRGGARVLVVAAFCGGAAVALGAIAAESRQAFVLAAAAVGLTVGTLTVGLSSELALWLGARGRGVKVAIGTGAAYLVVNWPPLFAGSPRTQAFAAAFAALAGALAVATQRHTRDGAAVRWARRVDAAGASAEPRAPRAASAGREVAVLGAIAADRRALFAAVLAFTALVGLDSAAFAIIQDTAALKAGTWGEGAQSLRMGSLHVAGAVAGGLLLDRRRFFPLLVGVYAIFAIGLGLLEQGGLGLASGALYAVGIGAYSVALVHYPSSGVEGAGLVPRRWRAAAVYGIGGWLGSALGVAVAERHDRVPLALVWVAGAAMAAAASLRHRRLAAPLAESSSVVALLAAVALWVHGVAAEPPRGPASRALIPIVGSAASVDAPAIAIAPSGEAAARSDPASSDSPPAGSAASRAECSDPARSDLAVARGREVYVAEGCVHCHSQYVRRAGADRELWGPWRPGAGDGDPPLHGVRRQGPDLANVGNRRSPTWQRLHLIDPRAVSPGSRMPGYAHLFAGSGAGAGKGTSASTGTSASVGTAASPGTDLVAYLSSLGADTGAERFRDVARLPIRVDPAASRRRGEALFASYCAQCHGATGRGDGALAPQLERRDALDLGRGTFALVSHGPGIGTIEEGLARVVRFGVAGTGMPGHEHLAENDVSALVAFVREIAPTRQAATPP